jgi:hypothetical protein
MKNCFRIIIIMLMSCMISKAQVAEYYFTQQNLAFTEIIGGTVLWSGTFDNEVSGVITIPSFTFNGAAYTSIYVSANGFITFGIAPTATNYAPISGSSDYTGAISAFGRDLNQAGTGSPAIRYEQVGNEFVIQWKDVRRKDIASETISFQVRLNTSNNYIYIVYGGTITPGSYTTYPQVGLRGAFNSDFNNRTIAAAGGNWINSSKGTGASNTMYFNSATPGTIPTAGLTYTWKPLYNPANFTATAISLSQIDLSWQKNPLNHNVMLAYNTSSTFGNPVSGTTYAVDGSIPGGGTVLFYGDGTSFSHTLLNDSIVYYYKIYSYDAVPDYSIGAIVNTRTAYPLTYLQNFNGASLPSEWSTNMAMTAIHGTAGSKGLTEHLTSGTAYAVAPLVGSITANTCLSFHYRIVDNLGYPLNATSLSSSDKIEIQVSADDGATFTTFHTIDQTNHTTTTEFANKVLSLAAYNSDFIKIRFLCTWGAGDYYVDIDNVLFEDGTNMSYSGSTTEQPNLTNIGIGTNNNEIIRLQVITQKNSNPFSMTSISVNATGATGDVSAAKIYYTTGTTFSTATQFGNTINNPSGAFSFTGSQVLVQGNNYFWMAFDIKPTATAGGTVDGSCSSFITSESGTGKIPLTLSPAGSRKISTVFSGTKSIPADYATIAAAVTALNNGVIGSDGVTFNIAAGHTESSTSPIILTATGTSSNPIIFQKSGTGNNPLVTRTDAGSVNTTTLGNHGDGVIIIEGADYITFDSINVTAQNQGIEYGYYLRKASVTDGCKNVTVKNANVTMTKGTSKVVVGFCAANNSSSASNIAITTNGGRHEYITFTGNAVSNVFTGIFLKGSSDFNDQNFTIGSSDHGNTIQNFAGNAAFEAYGIYLDLNHGSEISYNNINNMNGGGSAFTAAATGIYNDCTAEVDFAAEYNNINLTSTSSQLYGLYNSGTGTLQLNNNTIALSNTAPSTAVYAFIYNNQTSATTSNNTDINDNIFAASTFQTTGLTYMICNGNSRQSPEVTNIQGNATSGAIGRTGASGSLYLYYNGSGATGTENISGNDFSTITLSGSSVFGGIYSSTSASHTQNIFNNTISNIIGGSGTMNAINLANANTRSVYGNEIYSLSGGGIIYGINAGTGSNPGHIYKNEIYNLSSSSTSSTNGLVTGILITAGTSVYVYNNFISDLKTPSANNGDAIRGISITSSQANSTIGVYYNTIYLNAGSSGAAFGTSGLYHTSSSTSTTAALDLRNNIIINESTQNGTYFNVAFRRSTSALNNYLNTSNNNIFYAGDPGTYKLIYYASVSKQTIEDYRSYVGPSRDSISFSENPPFLNITTTPYNLRLQDGTTTYCESGGQPMTVPIVITNDFDGAARPATPDIGADEFSGISAYVGPPSSFVASFLNSRQIDLDFDTNPDDDDVVIVYNTTGTFASPSGTPVEGQPLAGGTVLFIGTDSPVTHSELTPGTKIYYKAFSYNGSNYSIGLSDDATPAVPPATGFSAVCAGQSQINLGWTKNTLSHDVIITAHSAYMSGNPVNGTAYNVGDPVPSAGTVIYKGPATAFNHTGLNSWSQYYYKAWSLDIYNYYSAGISANAITDADTVHLIPCLQGFGAAWSHSPAAPDQWKVVDVGGSGTLTWERITNFYYSAPAAAEGSGNQDDYLISQPVTLPDLDCRIVWWDRVSDAIKNNTYRVLLSATSSEPGSFTTSLDTFNCTNTTWTRHEIDLSTYKNQTIFIAFHQYYSYTQYSNFAIDEVLIETYILGPATLVFPTEGLLTFPDPLLKWAAPVSSDPPEGYRVYIGTDPDPDSLVYNGTNLSYQTDGLLHDTTYYWKIIPYNVNGDAQNVPVWSFATVTTTQLAESFEAGYFPPVSWSMDNGWSFTSSSSYHRNQCAVKYTFNAQSKLITPLLAISAGDKLEFFEGTSSSVYQRIQILYSPDKATWTNLGDPMTVTVAGWGHRVIDLGSLAGNNFYLALGVYNIGSGNSANVYIDHVTGPEIVPLLPAAATNPDPFVLDTYISLEPSLSWDPLGYGGIPSGYKLYLDEDPDPATLIYDGPDPAYQSGPLLHNTTYYWKVVPYNVVGEATGCPVWSFTTVPENAVQIGRDVVDYLDLPIYPDFSYSYTQTIYLKSEIEIADRRISRIYYQWNGGEAGNAYKDWVIYMGHTARTSFASTSDWVPVAQMTLVFDGEVTIPDSSGWVEILLDIPFEYNNSDNLVIAVDENTDGYAGGESVYFYGTEFSTSRGIKYYDDVTNPDPASPPTADQLVDGIANIRLQLEDLPTGPLFRVNPTSKDFGDVVLETESPPQTFTIKNNGIGTLTILNVVKSGTDATVFNLTDTNDYQVYLTANESIVVSVTFNPTTEGAKTAALEITDNISATSHQVPLTGNGLDATVSDFPFTETFEDESFTRNMWTQVKETGNGVWTFATGAGDGNINTAYDGILNARFTSTPSLKITKLVSPILNLTSLTDPQVVFWYGQEDWGGDQNELRVYYRTASDQPWLELYYDNTNRSEWTSDTLTLPNKSATYQLAFEGIDNYGYPNVLDNVSVRETPRPISIWTGGASGDWNDPDNWSDGIPGENYTVIISAGVFEPVIDTDITIYDITVETGSNIIITPDGSLTVTGK